MHPRSIPLTCHLMALQLEDPLFMLSFITQKTLKQQFEHKWFIGEYGKDDLGNHRWEWVMRQIERQPI